jgi:hypothetical protein
MLRHSYSSEAEIPSDVRSHYSQGGDGKFYLQVEGMVPKARVDEFRQTNNELSQQLEAEKKKTEGLNLVRAKELLDLDSKGQIQKKGEGSGDVEKEVEKRTKEMKEDFERRMNAVNVEHKKAIDDITQKSTALSTRLERNLIDDAITAAALKKGALPSAIDDIKARARATFKLDGDNIIAVDAKGNKIYGKDGMTILSVDEYVEKLPTDAPHLFQTNKGTGATGTDRTGSSNIPSVRDGKNPFVTGNLTDQGRLLAENPKEYERLKREANTK